MPPRSAGLLREVLGNPFQRTSPAVVMVECPNCGGMGGDIGRGGGDQCYTCGDSGLVEVKTPWLTDTVIGVAKAIYTERRFDEMGVLADAMEDAGLVVKPCSMCQGKGQIDTGERYDLRIGPFSEKDRYVLCPKCLGRKPVELQLLEHLRGKESHFRGCWAIDTIIGLK